MRSRPSLLQLGGHLRRELHLSQRSVRRRIAHRSDGHDDPVELDRLGTVRVGARRARRTLDLIIRFDAVRSDLACDPTVARHPRTDLDPLADGQHREGGPGLAIALSFCLAFPLAPALPLAPAPELRLRDHLDRHTVQGECLPLEVESLDLPTQLRATPARPDRYVGSNENVPAPDALDLEMRVLEIDALQVNTPARSQIRHLTPDLPLDQIGRQPHREEQRDNGHEGDDQPRQETHGTTSGRPSVWAYEPEE